MEYTDIMFTIAVMVRMGLPILLDFVKQRIDMTPKNIDQIIMMINDRKHLFVSDFSKITLEEFLNSGFPYKEIQIEGHDSMFNIPAPETAYEFEKFTSVFYPCLDFYNWWWMEYGNKDGIWS